jgi:hypothetical protein
LTPGVSSFFELVNVTKSQGFGPINIVVKWKRKYRDKIAKEPWFLLTNMGDANVSICTYQKRMGIEQMFRDFKQGGYNLESTKLDDKRLLSLIILISLAYTEATLLGDKLQSKGVSNYVGRVKENYRQIRRHSRFYLGLHLLDWLNSLSMFDSLVTQLLSISRSKSSDYTRGRRAIKLILSIL